MPRTLTAEAKATLAANLVAARERMKWKQGEAALRAGVTQNRLSLWETAKEVPSADGLIRLAVAYARPVDDFFGGVDEAYDAIIERRLPPDALRLVETQRDGLRRLAFRLIAAAEVSAPPTPAPAAAPTTVRGKSGSTRARRMKHPKPKPK